MSRILKRLTEQLDGNETLAKSILINRGHLNPDGTDTDQGKARGEMSPEDRALERQVRRYGGDVLDYEYDEETNSCRKIKG